MEVCRQSRPLQMRNQTVQPVYAGHLPVLHPAVHLGHSTALNNHDLDPTRSPQVLPTSWSSCPRSPAVPFFPLQALPGMKQGADRSLSDRLHPLGRAEAVAPHNGDGLRGDGRLSNWPEPGPLLPAVFLQLIVPAHHLSS